MEQLLTVDNLHTSFFTYAGEVKAVRGVSFAVRPGETLGIVGESGSGKSVTSLSILQVLQENGRVVDGSIRFRDRELVGMGKAGLREIRGRQISMIFQDPMSSLNPLMTVENQIIEAIREHNPISRQAARAHTLELLEKVRIPDPASRLRAYPHELSGGMRQRVVAAMALSCGPDLVIADEPTTALDVTIQDQLMHLLRDMQREMNMAILFITHDLGVVANMCDRVIVMYGGLIMEEATLDELFYQPSHPYTLGLLESVPKLTQDKGKRLAPIPGSPPDMLDPPAGCPFFPRCPYARRICVGERPDYFQLSPTHRSMCWLLSPGAPGQDNPFAKGGSAHAG